MFLLETNICIYLMKNAYPSLSEKLFSCEPAELFLSSITVFELEYGAAKSSLGEKNRQKMALFLAPFNILPFTSDDAITAGKIRAFLAQQGTPIGPYDILIASQGITRSMTVVTHNIKEFSRVPGIKLEDWV